MITIFSVLRTVDRIEQKLDYFNQMLEIIMSGMDDLKAAVAKETSVEAGAVVLMQGLVDQLKNTPPSDDAALKDLAAQLQTAMQPLADAVAANTVAAPADSKPIPGAPQPAAAASGTTGAGDAGAAGDASGDASKAAQQG